MTGLGELSSRPSPSGPSPPPAAPRPPRRPSWRRRGSAAWRGRLFSFTVRSISAARGSPRPRRRGGRPRRLRAGLGFPRVEPEEDRPLRHAGPTSVTRTSLTMPLYSVFTSAWTRGERPDEPSIRLPSGRPRRRGRLHGDAGFPISETFPRAARAAETGRRESAPRGRKKSARRLIWRLHEGGAGRPRSGSGRAFARAPPGPGTGRGAPRWKSIAKLRAPRNANGRSGEASFRNSPGRRRLGE